MNVELLRVIARVLSSDQRAGESQSSKRGAPLLTGAVVTILLCALSGNAVFTITMIAAGLLQLSMMGAQEIRRVLRTVMQAAGMACIFMLPSIWLGSEGAFGNVVMKVTESVLILSLLREKVAWKELTAAMGELHLPELFVLTLDMTVRFLVLLGRYSNQIVEAVSLRSVGARDWKSAGTGGILGNTFLKAGTLSEQTGEAMACRCWDGQYGRPSREADYAAANKCNRELRRSWLLVVLVLLAEAAWFLLTQKAAG